jgi:glycosyltransferase involved in cell wall biosynthesis
MIGAVAPSLFVVVPCYNEAAGIAATLEALARQSDPVFILLLVDNASTDGTVAAIEAFRAARPKMDIRIAAEPEKGTGAAADTGFRAAIAAGASHIARTDADSLPRADWIAAIKRGFAAGALFLAGPVRPRTDDHRLGLAERLCLDLLAALMSAVSPYLPHNRGAEFRCRYILASGGNLAIEAGLYRASGGFPRIALETDNEDRILQNRVRCLTASVRFLPDMVVAQSVRRIKRYGLRNTLLWYWNRKYKPVLVDIR